MIAKVITKDYKTFSIYTLNDVLISKNTDVNNIIPAFNNDIVEYENDKVIKVVNSSKKSLVGILETNSKILYGIDKRGNNVYMFYPLDKSYPNFLVASKLKGSNYLVVIDFLDWTKNRPRGCINSIIGVVDNLDNEINALIRHYHINTKISSNEIDNIIVNYKNNLEKFSKCDIDNIVSIDPIGCKDIDDAFSINRIGDNIHLNIYISNLAYSIDIDSNLYKCAMINSETLYLENYNIPLYPEILSNNLFSLLEGNKKLVLALKLVIDNNGNICSSKFESLVISVDKNLSYENCQSYDKIDWNLVRDGVKILSNKLKLEYVDDSHFWVEIMMIYYNYVIADKSKYIYRVQSGKLNFENSNLPISLKFLAMDSAEYSYNRDKHNSLGLECYTHATSPIRRFVDLLVQRCVCLDSRIDISMLSLNNNSKNIRRFNKYYLYLTKLYNNSNKMVDGVVISKLSSDKYMVYIKLWNKIVNVRLNGINLLVSDDVKLNYYVNPESKCLDKKLIFSVEN